MDINTFIQKISDTIYNGCDKKRKYKEILKNIQTSIDNENITPVPYYYISVLNVVEDMGIQDYNDDAMEEKLKKYSRELTLSRLCTIVSDMFERHFDDDEDVVKEFTDMFIDAFNKEFDYLKLLADCTSNTLQRIRIFVKQFTENLEDFDFTSFDKELTENLYDCIDCEDEFEDVEDSDDSDEDYDPDSNEETDDSDDDSEEEGVHTILDLKIEEIRTLKDKIECLEFQVLSMKDINDKYSSLLQINEERCDEARKMFRYGFVMALMCLFAPIAFRESKFQLDHNLLN